MSDNLVKRLEDPPFGTETSERNLMAQAAAALVAKDAENARLRVAMTEIIAATDNSGIEYASVGMRVAERVEDIARAALNTQHKGETS